MKKRGPGVFRLFSRPQPVEGKTVALDRIESHGTAAQIAANRRNALRSTGPRTAAGKAVSSRNALRHGLTARATVVLDEDPQDFERLRAELWTELAPRDAREELLVETVVQAAWRMRRAWRAEARLFNRAGRLDRAFSQPRELLTIIRHEASANRAFHRGLALLERGRSAAGAARPSRRQGGRPETNIYEKGTQFRDAADHSTKPWFAASTQVGRPETLVYEKGTQFPDARPAPDPLASSRLSRDAADNPESPLFPRGPPQASGRVSLVHRGPGAVGGGGEVGDQGGEVGAALADGLHQPAARAQQLRAAEIAGI
jgi:hypothetical protein